MNLPLTHSWACHRGIISKLRQNIDKEKSRNESIHRSDSSINHLVNLIGHNRLHSNVNNIIPT